MTKLATALGIALAFLPLSASANAGSASARTIYLRHRDAGFALRTLSSQIAHVKGMLRHRQSLGGAAARARDVLQRRLLDTRAELRALLQIAPAGAPHVVAMRTRFETEVRTAAALGLDPQAAQGAPQAKQLLYGWTPAQVARLADPLAELE